MPVALIAWKAMERNSLRGFATIRLGKSLTIKDVTVHENNGKRWASFPSKPMLDSNGNTKRDDVGKVQYVPILEWADRDAKDRFSEAVVAAIEAEHPDALRVGG